MIEREFDKNFFKKTKIIGAFSAPYPENNSHARRKFQMIICIFGRALTKLQVDYNEKIRSEIVFLLL